jgi:cellulose synthase (UDP-forming)
VYVSRARDGAGNADYKAGNLNYGLARAHGEYVMTLDADQVPEPDILERLAPYLTIPRTAFVQSRQSFLVPEGDPFYCQDLVFYNTLQPAFDAHDMVLSCGSGVLYRRAALDENGGFATWNLVEDLTTSYELHSRGWKSMYYPYPLAAGLAPDTVWGVYKQRGQWAFDTMRLFFWRNPLLQRGLAWQKRINYFIIGYSYITAGFIAPLFYLIPIWTYVTGHTVLTGREIDFALFRTLYFLTMTLAMRWLFHHHEPGKQFQMLVGLFPIYAVNTIRALWYPRSKPGYTVNNQRPARRARAWPPIVALTPQLALLLANAIGPFYALLMHTTSPRIVAANACVSAMAIWSLSHVCIAALDKHSWQRERDPVTFYALPARH